MTSPIAHAGHWLAEFMYVMPVLAIVVWISIKSVLDRRRDEREAAEGGGGAAPPPPPAGPVGSGGGI